MKYLAKELRSYGVRQGAQAFRERVMAAFQDLYPAWTVDRLVECPRKALGFAQAIRKDAAEDPRRCPCRTSRAMT